MGRARYSKRKTRQIYRRLDTVMADLLLLADIFKELHPPLALYLELTAKATLKIQEMVVKFYAKAWDSPPGDWYSDARMKGD